MADRQRVAVLPRWKDQGEEALSPSVLHHSFPSSLSKPDPISEAFSFPFYKQMSRQRFASFSHKMNP